MKRYGTGPDQLTSALLEQGKPRAASARELGVDALTARAQLAVPLGTRT